MQTRLPHFGEVYNIVIYEDEDTSVNEEMKAGKRMREENDQEKKKTDAGHWREHVISLGNYINL